jgi:[acyl-carrier-protein] S-malonyltransferase
VEVAAPRVPVYSNVTAQPFPSDPAAIRALLGRQLCEPVKWEGTLAALVGAGAQAAAAPPPPRAYRQLPPILPGRC